eukprot:jgi/Chlat1/2246/Chrsp17S02562
MAAAVVGSVSVAKAAALFVASGAPQAGKKSRRAATPAAVLQTLSLRSSQAVASRSALQASSKCIVPKASRGVLHITCETDVAATPQVDLDTKKKIYRDCKQAVEQLIKDRNCNPIMIRAGWHDAGTYNVNIEEWPQRGGTNGSLRFPIEQGHGANAGMVVAYNLLKPINKKFPEVTWADLFQMAGAVAIEVAGGPAIDMKYGRVDTTSDADCPESGRLPDADPKTTGRGEPAEHLRNVFYRMGLNDQDIVALSGAHTMGRVRQDRSGFGVKETKYTKDGPGIKGGQSWTPEWLVFDNSYFVEVKEKRDADLVVLPTDAALFEDDGFKQYAEKYAVDQEAFFKDYAVSHKKLSELGAKWNPEDGFSI